MIQHGIIFLFRALLQGAPYKYNWYPLISFFAIREIRARIRIVISGIRTRPKRNRGVEATEILFVTPALRDA